MNKEREGLTVRFSVRLPKEQHKTLKEISDQTRKTENFISMNEFISYSLELLFENLAKDKK